MKRIFILLLLSIFLISCQKSNDNPTHETNSTNADKPKYQVLITDYSNSISSAQYEIEYRFEDKENNVTPPQEIMTITVNDMEVSGKYDKTIFTVNSTCPKIIYKEANGNSFAVDDSGVLSRYSWDVAEPKQPYLTQEECLEIAKQFFSTYADVDQYQITVSPSQTRDLYQIYFTKYINGMKTEEYAQINVFFDGQLAYYTSNMLNKIDEKNIRTDIDLEDAEQAVYAKLDQIYVNAKEKYTRIEYAKPNFEITVLKDGSTALLGNVEIKGVKVLNDYEERTGERIYFFILTE